MIEMMTKPGTYHIRSHTENQDAVLFGTNRRLTGLFLADGISECARSGAGARFSCETVKKLLMDKGECFFDLEAGEIARFAAAHVYHELRARAGREGQPVEEYASTLSCALLDRRTGRLMTLNLGDGLIAGVRGGKMKILAAPDDSSRGCCGTTTRGAELWTDVSILDARDLDAVFVCSDGAWKALFDGGRINPAAETLLREENCAALAEYLRRTETFDDCSFICMDLTQDGGWSNEPAKCFK